MFQQELHARKIPFHRFKNRYKLTARLQIFVHARTQFDHILDSRVKTLTPALTLLCNAHTQHKTIPLNDLDVWFLCAFRFFPVFSLSWWFVCCFNKQFDGSFFSMNFTFDLKFKPFYFISDFCFEWARWLPVLRFLCCCFGIFLLILFLHAGLRARLWSLNIDKKCILLYGVHCTMYIFVAFHIYNNSICTDIIFIHSKRMSFVVVVVVASTFFNRFYATFVFAAALDRTWHFIKCV